MPDTTDTTAIVPPSQSAPLAGRTDPTTVAGTTEPTTQGGPRTNDRAGASVCLPQPGEPDDLYRLFLAYRDAGQGRSLRSTFAAVTGGNPRAMPGTWSRAATKWRWEARAKAWDAQQIGADLRGPLRRELRDVLADVLKVARSKPLHTANDNRLLSELEQVAGWLDEVSR